MGVLRRLCRLSSGDGARAGGQFGSLEHLGDIYSPGRDEITSQPVLVTDGEGWKFWAWSIRFGACLPPPNPNPSLALLVH